MHAHSILFARIRIDIIYVLFEKKAGPMSMHSYIPPNVHLKPETKARFCAMTRFESCSLQSQ